MNPGIEKTFATYSAKLQEKARLEALHSQLQLDLAAFEADRETLYARVAVTPSSATLRRVSLAFQACSLDLRRTSLERRNFELNRSSEALIEWIQNFNHFINSSAPN